MLISAPYSSLRGISHNNGSQSFEKSETSSLKCFLLFKLSLNFSKTLTRWEVEEYIHLFLFNIFFLLNVPLFVLFSLKLMHALSYSLSCSLVHWKALWLKKTSWNIKLELIKPPKLKMRRKGIDFNNNIY